MSLTFIKSEAGARLGALTTGGGTAVTFMDQISPFFKFITVVFTAVVAVATAAYYIPLAIEKWQALIEKWRQRK